MKLGCEHGVNEAFTHFFPQPPALFNPLLLPKSRGPGPLWSLPSQMLATQLGPCRLPPSPARCWPTHGGQGVLAKPPVSRGGAGVHAPVAHVEPSGRLHLQEDNCPARGGQPHWRLLGSPGWLCIVGSERKGCSSPKTKTETFYWQHP